MTEHTFPTEPRPFPSDQTRVPMPPLHGNPYARLPHAEDADASWRTNVVRVRGLQGDAVDLHTEPDAVASTSVADLFPGFAHAHVVSGVHAFGRLTTPAGDRASLDSLHQLLDLQAWSWTPCVTASATRQWVEPGALLLGADDEDVATLARRHGQARVLRWDAAGLAPADVTPRGLLAGGRPVPVVARPARTGCPLRAGANEWCKRVGGPWVSAAITAAMFWEAHRALLVDALGCDVCHGGPVAQGGPSGLVEVFTPSRTGGWQRGGPRPSPRE